MRVVRYRAGARRYLAVDAERYVPDREAFAARLCDPEAGLAPHAGEGDGLVHADRGVPGPREGPGSAADDHERVGDAPGVAAADHERVGDAPGVAADGGPGAAETDETVGADGMLFLALESRFHPPRVVMTVVHPDGERTPCCTEGVRCAARWATARTDADRVMVDTQAGTREARVHADGSVSVEVGEPDAGAAPMERGPVVREFATDVERPRP